MADSPEDAVALSDDDLDDLVSEVEGNDDTASTEDPEDDSPASVDDGQADEEEGPESPADGEEDDTEDVGSQAAPEAVPPAPVATTPFQFKGAGSVHTLPGAVQLPDGSVSVPREAVTQLVQRLASQVELQGNFKNLQREANRKINQLKSERSDKDIEADAVINLMTEIQQMTPEERWDYFEKFDQDIPKLQLEVERQKLERDRKALLEERNPTPFPEDVAEERTNLIMAEMGVTYEKVMNAPDVTQYLSKDEVNAIFQRHAKRPERLVVKEGDEEMFDESDIIEDLKLLIDLKKKQAGTVSAAKKNEKRNADVNAIPPVVRSRVPAGKPKGKGPEKFSGGIRGDFKKTFLRGELDDD